MTFSLPKYRNMTWKLEEFRKFTLLSQSHIHNWNTDYLTYLHYFKI